jgi:CRISPR-associated protein Csd2
MNGDQPPNAIFVKEKAILNDTINQAYIELNIDLNAPPTEKSDGTKRNKPGQGQGKEIDKAREFLCKNFFDIRTFGAVMSTGANAGQVRGPIQMTFARSCDPVVALEHSITRMAVATQEEAEKQGGGNRTMGRKFTVPYGLYRAHGFVSAPLANQTGFSKEDLELFWEALKNMFEHDRSAARGLMATRGLFVFEHDSKMGNAQAHELFDRILASRLDSTTPARKFSDYKLEIDREGLPTGVNLIQMA